MFWWIRKTLYWVLAYSVLQKIFHELEDDEDESDEARSKQMKEAVKQVKRATEAEKIGADGGDATDVDTNNASTGKTEVVDDGDEEDDQMVPDEQPEDAIFIPVGWPRQLPRVFYKGSDPEWQSFLKFAGDMGKPPAVKKQLAGIVLGFLSDDRRLQKFLGTPIGIRQYWLDIDFPYGPPIEYERSGLEITDDYIAWVARPVEPFNVARLKKALLPVPVLHSLWESSKVVWDVNLTKLKRALDIDSSTLPKSQHPPGHGNFPQLMKEAQDDNKDTGTLYPPPPQRKLENYEKLKYLIFWCIPGFSGDMPGRAFRKTMAKKLGAAGATDPPRGTILVSGLVELKGPKGVCLVEVRAAYHPQDEKWVNIGLAFRRLQPSSQKPKGGA